MSIRTSARSLCALLLALLLALSATPLAFAAEALEDADQAVLEDEGEFPPEEDSAEEISPEELLTADEEISALSADAELTTKARLDKIFKSYETMGACVVVMDRGEIVFTHTYGLRMKARGKLKSEPMTEDTLFQVGSISKMVAGVGLLALVEDGKAELDSDLGDLLGFPVRHPGYPDTPITLRQLMTHTSSMRDNGRYNAAINGRPTPLPLLFRGNVARFTYQKDVPPGTAVEYSNFGGGVAGSVIEALSGQTIDEYLQQRVFGPLGITAGYQASMLPKDLKLADMYEMPGGILSKELLKDPTRITTPDPELDYYLTAGKLIISAPDLAKIVMMLCDMGYYDGVQILGWQTALEMRTPQNNRGSVKCDSDRGLFMNIITDFQVEGRTMYGHGGKANGMLCAAYFDPVDRTGVIMLTNGCNDRKMYHGVGMLGRQVMAVCYAEQLDPRHATEVPWLVVEE